MIKKVTFKGNEYKIDIRQFGFDSRRLVINGESSSAVVPDVYLLNVDSFKEYVRKAIEEYEARKKSEDVFKAWDGKL